MPNDNLPPLPEKEQIDKHIPTGIVLRGYTAEQMQAYARAAIERQSVPDGSHQLLKRLEWQEVRHEYRESEYFCPVCDEFKKDGHRSDCELAARLAAAPQPQPVQLLTGLILPKHRCPLTGAGIPDPTTFGEKQ